MGSSLSTPAPTDQDLMVQHDAAQSSMILGRDLALPLVPTKEAKTFEFELAEHCWKKKAGTNAIPVKCFDDEGKAILEDLNFVTSCADENNHDGNDDGNASTCCVLAYKGKPMAVLLLHQPQGRAFYAQICVFDEGSPSLATSTQNPNAKQTSCAAAHQHKGRPLYAWATVTRQTNVRQYTMKTTTASAKEGGNLYTSHSTRKSVRQKDNRKKHVVVTIKRDGVICASLEQQEGQESTWKCRVCPGIDAALIMCFVACTDKLREEEWATVKKKHGVGLIKPSRVL